MDTDLLRSLFHNCLSVSEGLEGLRPERFTPRQWACFAAITYHTDFIVKAHESAGITLEFDTDADRFTLCWQILDGYQPGTPNRQSTLDVYVNGALHGRHRIRCGFREPQRTVFPLGEGSKRVTVYLPHTYVFALGDILLPQQAALSPVPPRQRKLLMIGDSITQGLCSDFASGGYAMQIARRMDCECVNQSIAAIRFEAGSIDPKGFSPQLITVAVGTNDWTWRKDREEYDSHAAPFFAALDKAYPGVPVLVLSPIKRCRGEADLPADRPGLYRESELYGALTRLCSPYPQMRCIDGWTLTPHTPDCFVDGLHPNNVGMTRYADALAKVVEPMLE